jgi:S1-C subfamily serine protease
MSQGTNPLVELSDALADAVERAGASTVTVKARRRLAASGLIWSEDGLIVTANHVVERDEDIVVVLPDGTETPAELVGRDPSTDVAALRIEGASGLTPAPRAASAARPGQIVLALGRPYGTLPQVALGGVSAVGSTLRTRGGGQVEGAVRPDLTMYPGFSGGPLVNAAGEVLGMNTSALTRGLPVAIPHAVLDRVVGVLREKGRIARGYLGLALQPVRIPAGLRDKLEDGQEAGLLIIGIEADSPAEQAGLMLGDTMISFGGVQVSDPRQVHEQLGPDSVGTALAVRLLRAGERLDLSVTPGER